RKDRQSIEYFSVGNFAGHYFFNQTNASQVSASATREGDTSPNKGAACRSSRHAANITRQIQNPHDCVRRWTNPVSCLVGARPHRSTQSDNRALSVRRS